MTVVVTVLLVSLEVFWSCAAKTEAVLLIADPQVADVVENLRIKLRAPPGATFPEQVTAEPTRLQPTGAEAESRARPAGTTSVIMNALEAKGLLFVTFTIYERRSPFKTVTGADLVMKRSGQATVVETVLLVSLAAFGSIGAVTDATLLMTAPHAAGAVENLRRKLRVVPAASLAVQVTDEEPLNVQPVTAE
jgi:hypothetical protein